MRYLISVLLFTCLLACVAGAEEGLWPFEAAPVDTLAQRHGFRPAEGWLDNVRLSSVRVSGASGAFVSPQGLILTNQHVASLAVQALSTPRRNIVLDGFYAPTLKDELKVPGLHVDVLESMEDVTKQVQSATRPGMTAAQADAARRAVTAGLIRESDARTKLRTEMVTFYQGGQYKLYRYRRYEDVRLVMSPEKAIAFLGEDVDNFEYPRYNLDITFLRVYEGDRPLRTRHWLPISTRPPVEGQLVFMSGHPAFTSRGFSLGRMQNLRDVTYPWLLDRDHGAELALALYANRGPEERRQAADELYGVQNDRKRNTWHYYALLDPQLMKQKAEAEGRLRSWVEADPARKAAYGDPWTEIVRIRTAYVPWYARHWLFEYNEDAFQTIYFRHARLLVRLAAERKKPDAQRIEGYREGDMAAIEDDLAADVPVYADMERAKLREGLTFMVTRLGAQDPTVVKLLAGLTPAERAAQLVAGTKLGDVAVRRRLVKAESDELRTSSDPMIQLALAVDDEARALRQRYNEEVRQPSEAAFARLARATFAFQGTGTYPDATSTLRLSFGTVKGYQSGGASVPWATTLGGLYALTEAHGQNPPYRLPARWMERRASLDPKTPFNFVFTADGAGGNSGSPVIDREGQVVGVYFDCNLQGLASDFVYTDTQGRQVAVTAQSILEALRKVYDARRLVEELVGGR